MVNKKRGRVLISRETAIKSTWMILEGILHGKKWRVRKKYYDRARRRMLARAAREKTT